MDGRSGRIRTQERVRNVRKEERSAGLAGSLKKTAVRTRDRIADLTNDGVVTPEEYAEKSLRSAAREAAAGTHRQTGRAAAKVRGRIRGRRLFRRQNTAEAGRLGERSEGASAAVRAETGRRYGVREHETRIRSVRRDERNARKADSSIPAIRRKERQPEMSRPKTRMHTVRTADWSVKTAGNASKGTVKTADVSAETAKKAAEASVRAAKRSAELSRRAAAVARRTASEAGKTVAAAVKGFSSAARDTILAVAAGGWIAVAVVVLICLIGLIAGSGFGIFFSGEKTGGTVTMRQAIWEINEEYESRIEEIREQNPHDDLEMSGSRAIWPQVLSVYAVKTTTDPDCAMDVATVDEQRRQILSDIFWAMNDISWRTKTKTEKKIVESDDGSGNIVQTEVEETHTTLYITVSHRDAEEMAEVYCFDSSQNDQLQELIAADASMWSAVLYGVYGSDEGIVQVALSQIGNIGGEPYWSWYGFESRVEWCACFVSWCADQCGDIEGGVIPKYAGCVNGVNWFRERGQWADGSVEPAPGMIVFFDWDDPSGASGPQDGLSDHTGIVEKVEDGYVYTVEGNTRNRCLERRYPVGSYLILGYGVPAF